MRKVIGTLAAVSLAIGAYALAPIEEDNAAWNCYIHGNHICNTTNYAGFIPLTEGN